MQRCGVLFAILILAGSQLKAATLDWKPIQGGRSASVAVPPGHKPGFTAVPASSSGIEFTNVLLTARKQANANLMNGSGVGLGDYDGDGLCDIYLCDLNGTNALFRNLGNWKFKNVTREAGVACPGQTSTGAVFADVNGDGRLDLLVTSMGGPHACFINLGNGTFTNTIASAGFTSRYGGTSMALGDVDGNGTLDLYVANYGVTSILRSGGSLNVTYVNGKPVVRGRYANRIKIIDNTMWELGEPDGLYLNDGQGHFKQVSWTDGSFRKEDGSPLKEEDIPWDQGLSVMFRDINGDGAPDIYVCNDAFTPDRFWINDGKGHFRALETKKWRTTSYFSMGVDFADIDRDGLDDFLVVDMLSRQHHYALTQKGTMPAQAFSPGDSAFQLQVRHNTLQRNNGDGSFSDLSFYAGVAGSEWSWSGIFLDVDLDGWEDLLVSNGFDHNTDDMDVQEKVRTLGQMTVEQARRAMSLYPPLRTPNVAFQNLHNLTFKEVGKEWGFDSTDVSNGMALADLDNDGDLDVIINCLNGSALVYRNDCSAPRVGVRLKGKSPNTQGIGARITVSGGPVLQEQEVISGGRYVGGDDPMRVFACGHETSRLKIEVKWRSGLVSVLEGAEPNTLYELDEAAAQPAVQSAKLPVQPIFTDASNLLGHKHVEPGFDDFALQPSLPWRLSQYGPAVLAMDLTGDGLDDVVIGTGRSGEVAFYQNDGKAHFERKTLPWGKEESAGIAAWKKENGESELLIAINNYEQKSGHNIAAYSVRSNGTVQPVDYGAVFAGNSVGGPLAVTNVNGTPFLFAGTRFVAGRYPEPASSHLFQFKNGKWELETRSESVLQNIGLVTGAVWADLNGDRQPELIVSCEWRAIRAFTLEKDHLVERSLGIKQMTGLWQSIAAADVDGDGRIDLIAGNQGLNSFYNQAQTPGGLLRIYFGEFTAPGRVDMFEAYFDEQMRKIVPWRDKRVLATAMPWLNEKYPTHASFAESGIAEILAGRPKATELSVQTLEHAVFLNRGDHFEMQYLPTEAQWAPVFGICAADFNGDGRTDLVLAQNFFAVRENDSRLDAGRGLLLLGQTDGRFRAVTATESGLQIFGEQRGVATADFNRDGRIDLVVSQNGEETKLYLNAGGSPVRPRTQK